MTQQDFDLHSEYVQVYQNYLKAIFQGNASETWKEILIKARKVVFRKLTNLHLEKPDKRKKIAVSISERDKIIVLNHKFFAWLRTKMAATEEEYNHFEY